jgi:rhodanese-related sulfurtransferase
MGPAGLNNPGKEGILVKQIHVRDLAEKMAAGQPIYLLDVRQPWEHETAALPGSVLIPLHELPARAEEVQPPAGALVVVYCHHGIRSLSGAAILERMGVAEPHSLAGGIDAWSVQVDPRVPRY